jgi:mono/diheme cytochrome c family protein
MRRSRRITVLTLLLAAGSFAGCAGDPDPGTRVWRKKCAACHGRDGAGKTRFAEGRPFADLTDGRFRHAADRASMRRLVADGDPTSTMPPFAGTLTPEEIDAVVGHVLRLASGSPGESKP